MKTYTGYLQYEAPKDYPKIGEVFVALDINNSLGPQTWVLAIMGDSVTQDDCKEIGFFKKVGFAVNFGSLAERDKSGFLNELLSDVYKAASGKQAHSSDCATSQAPAERPGPCNCAE